MPLINDPNDNLARKLSALVELVGEGEIDNEWEIIFIDSIVERFEKGISFSEKQLDKVNELYERYY